MWMTRGQKAKGQRAKGQKARLAGAAFFVDFGDQQGYDLADQVQTMDECVDGKQRAVSKIPQAN
jgi:hypothetical protein